VAEKVSRRKFLSRATAGLAAGIAAVWAVPAVSYVLSPARKQEGEEEWVALGSVDKIEPGLPSLFKARITRTNAWVTTEEEVAVYVFTEDGRDFVGLSNICTHLGCRVRWVTDQAAYFCPCHNASFNTDGTVATGPPPRPLEPFELKVEEGQVFVKLEA
jgi:Rieske Fe-S protein